MYIKKILIISLFSKDITEGADLTLVFMDELNEETNAMSYDYEMADNKTTILIKRDALFATEHIAHEIGHVLGAGHGPDISKLKLKVPYSDALVHRPPVDLHWLFEISIRNVIKIQLELKKKSVIN